MLDLAGDLLAGQDGGEDPQEDSGAESPAALGGDVGDDLPTVQLCPQNDGTPQLVPDLQVHAEGRRHFQNDSCRSICRISRK